MRFRVVIAVGAWLLPALASAQVMPGQPRPGGLPPPGQPGHEEEEGPAEQAPEEPEKEPTLQPLPGFSMQKERRLQFFELGGYIRFRGEFWHQFNLGFNDANQPVKTGTPFQLPADCYPPDPGTDPRMEGNRPCDNNLSTANMRLRMEPVVNVSEQVRVKAQIDFLDNLVLGSTPDGTFIGNSGIPGAQSPPASPPNIPIAGFNRTQVPPQAGRNSTIDSVQVKRAWAEVRTPFGLLSFGRMPSHWGTGMFVNAGDCRWTPDCMDSDFGVNADRVLFATELSGIRIIGLFDWAATGPTSDRLSFGINQYQGEPFDATNRDDVSQYGLAIGKIDTPEEWRDKTERLDKVWNLGAYFVYRSQDLDEAYGTPIPLGADPSQIGRALVKRNASAGVIDFWGRMKWYHLWVEAEGTLIVGGLDFAPTETPAMAMGATHLDILQGGGVGRIVYSALHDSLKLKFESGFATGDQAESTLPGQTNYTQTPIIQPRGDTTISNFHFDPDYHVDLILFRRIIGTVTNAVYVKPSIQWDPTTYMGAELAAVQSFAMVPVATPGNAVPYGLEFDVTLSYRNVEEGFYAGFQYGVLFPMGALDEPTTQQAIGGVTTGSLFPVGNGSESVAQTIRTFLGVKF